MPLIIVAGMFATTLLLLCTFVWVGWRRRVLPPDRICRQADQAQGGTAWLVVLGADAGSDCAAGDAGSGGGCDGGGSGSGGD